MPDNSKSIGEQIAEIANKLDETMQGKLLAYAQGVAAASAQKQSA